MTVHCATCGHGLTVRAAIRHAERCFNKFESQTSFGSIFQTRIEGNNMFCDFYNPHNRTYCKRLRVLCPEHCKDPKVLFTCFFFTEIGPFLLFTYLTDILNRVLLGFTEFYLVLPGFT